MRGISRTIAQAGIFLVPLWTGCTPASQEEAAQPASNTPTETTADEGGTTKKSETLTPEEKFTQLLADCSAVGKDASPLASIADAVALINKLPRPATVPCFIAAIPRPFQLTATDSTFSGQPAKDKVEPRYFVHTNGMLITLVSAGVGKNKVEFSELRGSTESIKGEVAFPIEADVTAEQPYTSIFNSSNGTTSCGFCHVNERPAGAGYPPEATISRALAPAPTRIMLYFELSSLAEQCKASLGRGCTYARALFHNQTPSEYTIPSDMPLK